MGFQEKLNRALKHSLPTASPQELEQELQMRRLQENPFPVHLFPARLRPFIDALITEIDCAPCYVGGSMLSVLSTVIGSYYQVAPTNTWSMGLTTWVANVGISSGGKSMTETYMLAEIRKIQKELDAENLAAERRDENAETPFTERGRKKEIVIQNTTFEAMVKETMVDNPKGVFKLEDELTSWLDGMKQYSSTDIERKMWLSAWNCRPYKMRRSGNKYIYVERPYACVLGGVQPRFLSKFFSDDLLGEGFTPRMLFNVPEEHTIANANLRYRFDQGAMDAYGTTVRDLYYLLEVGFDQDPKRIGIKDDALDIYISWEKGMRESVNAIGQLDTFPKDVAAMAFGKLKEYCFKFSAIMAILDHYCAGFPAHKVEWVRTEHMEAGIAFADYYYSSFRSAYLMSSSKLFVPIEILDLARLWKSGMSYGKMAEVLGQKKTTVFNRIQKAVKEYPHAFGAKAG